jgi:hypothetical protein
MTARKSMYMSLGVSFLMQGQLLSNEISYQLTPSSGKVLYATEKTIDSAVSRELHVANTDGSSDTLLATGVQEGSTGMFVPGTNLVSYAKDQRLKIMNLDAQELHDVVLPPGAEDDFSFSLDGARLYLSDDTGGIKQYVLSTRQTSTLIGATAVGEPDYNPVVSPDGDHVAYLHPRSTSSIDIRLVNSDGTGSEVILQLQNTGNQEILGLHWVDLNNLVFKVGANQNMYHLNVNTGQLLSSFIGQNVTSFAPTDDVFGVLGPGNFNFLAFSDLRQGISNPQPGGELTDRMVFAPGGNNYAFTHSAGAWRSIRMKDRVGVETEFIRRTGPAAWDSVMYLGWSDLDFQVLGSVLANVPPPIVGVSLADEPNDNGTQINVTFTNPGDNNGIEIFRSTSPITSFSGLTPIATVSSSPYSDTGVTAGQNYHYAVRWTDWRGKDSTAVESNGPVLAVNDNAGGTGGGTETTTQTPVASGGGGGGGGCFIATAAYGTDMAPELDHLRGFRDQVLLPTTAGKAFVDAYYTHAPPIAQFMEDKPHVRWAVRQTLRPFVWMAKKSLEDLAED